MKYQFPIFIILIAFAFSCKKSDSDNNNSISNNGKCNLLKMTQTLNGVQDNYLYAYDNSNRLECIKHIDSYGDTSTSLFIFISTTFLGTLSMRHPIFMILHSIFIM